MVHRFSLVECSEGREAGAPACLSLGCLMESLEYGNLDMSSKEDETDDDTTKHMETIEKNFLWVYIFVTNRTLQNWSRKLL